MSALFVDTGAFFATADTSDRHHEAAKATFVARGTAGDLVTSDHVVIETWYLLRSRLGRPAAMRFWDAMETGVVKVIGITSEDFVQARQIARRWPDQAFSIVDCTSFAAMERLRITQAFAFDKHFGLYRYGKARNRAFEMVPALAGSGG
jgi:predicted nucleic acid-binding protein